MKLLAIAAALSFAAGLSAEVQKKDVDIKAPDGVSLRGTYFSAGRPGPAMLLLHQCNMDRHAWDGLAEDLAGNGFQVLTIDFRGFGESGGSKSTDPSERAAARQKWPADVDAAFAYLTRQKGVDQSRIAVGGASCGVTQSSDLAARHHEIRAADAAFGHGKRCGESLHCRQPDACGVWRCQRGRHGCGEGNPRSSGGVEGP